mgnify:CR=1 FL=1
MRKPIVLVLFIRILISFSFIAGLTEMTGCSSVAGDVIPKTGPKMEQVYDSMKKNSVNNHDNDNSGNPNFKNMRDIRAHVQAQRTFYPRSQVSYSSYSSERGFKRLPNPELKMYIYPHFSGSDQVPVPGYQTVFNAYEKNYYTITRQG